MLTTGLRLRATCLAAALPLVLVAPLGLTAQASDSSSTSATAAATVVWPTPAQVSDPEESLAGSFPQVAVLPDGSSVAVWDRGGTLGSAVRPAGGVWSEPVEAVASIGFARNIFEHRVVAGSDGSVTAIWQRGPGDVPLIQSATRSPEGVWGSAESLSAPDTAAFSGDLAAGPDGSVAAIWLRGDGFDDRVEVTVRSPEGVWSEPEDISGALVSGRRPQVAVGADGTLSAVWGFFDETHERLQAAVRPPGGSWSTPVDLSAPATNAYESDVAVSPSGVVTAVWNREVGGITLVEASSRAPQGDWSAAAVISGDENTSSFGPRVTVDGAGRLTAVWSRDADEAGVIEGASSPPGGGAWTDPLTLSDPGEGGQEAKSAVGPDGSVLVSWSGGSEGPDVLRAAVRSPAGVWGDPETLSTPSIDAADPELSIGPDGTAAVVYVSRPQFETDQVTAVTADRAFAVQPPPPPPTKVRPRLVLKAAPQRDRRAPYVFGFSGRLAGSFEKARPACGGRVAVTVKQRRSKLAAKSVRVRANCTYSLRVKIADRKVRGKRSVRLTVTAAFAGNDALRPARATARVRVR